MSQSLPSPSPPLDRFFCLAILIAAAIVIPRSILITRAHSPCADDQFHLRRGLHYLTNEPPNLVLTSYDGPLGQALEALPMLLTGSTMAEPIHPENLAPGQSFPQASIENPAQKFARIARQDVLLGHALSPDALLLRIAIWKAILFIPFAALIFHWSRWLYGLHAGFIALAMLLIDPNFAAHIPVASIDCLSAQTIVFACFALWLWARNPTSQRLIFAAFASAFALLTKQIAVALPLAAIAYAAVWWLWNPAREVAPRNNRILFNRLAGFFLLFFLFIWVLTKFDCSTPGDWIDPIYRPTSSGFSIASDVFYRALQHRWPAGQYLAAFINSVRVDMGGRWGFLLGQARIGGWWYYYPVLLAFKAPLGFFLIFFLAIYSLWRRPPFFEEWSLLIPTILWGALLLTSNVNIGIRHFLPEYAFLIILASRCVSFILHPSSFILRFIAWLGIATAFAHTLSYHPDYLSYINFPYQKPWLLTNDSNIDWGQGLKQTRQWLDQHPSNGRPVYIRYDWDPVWVDYYLNGRAQRLTQFQSPPHHGLLVICPIWVAGYWDPWDTYKFLRPCTPDAIIGHSMLVYDLDHLHK